MALGRGPEELICSQRQCENPAEFAITWTNPALPFGRAKHWLACADHRGTLEDYLAYRQFPIETEPLAEFLSRGGAAAPKSTGFPRN